jgi:hypothetical protein
MEYNKERNKEFNKEKNQITVNGIIIERMISEKLL